MPILGRQTYSVDRDATVLAYGRTERGGADRRTCIWCRNFRLARAKVLPAEFLALLDKLGIDPPKEVEVFHAGSTVLGRHHYAGWYHFVGALDKHGDFEQTRFGESVTAYLCEATAPRIAGMKGLPAVQLEFEIQDVPWLLDEPEPA